MGTDMRDHVLLFCRLGLVLTAATIGAGTGLGSAGVAKIAPPTSPARRMESRRP